MCTCETCSRFSSGHKPVYAWSLHTNIKGCTPQLTFKVPYTAAPTHADTQWQPTVSNSASAYTSFTSRNAKKRRPSSVVPSLPCFQPTPTYTPGPTALR